MNINDSTHAKFSVEENTWYCTSMAYFTLEVNPISTKTDNEIKNLDLFSQ